MPLTQRNDTTKERKIFFKCGKCGNKTHAFTDTQRFEQKICKKCFGKKKDLRPKELNDLTGAEWAKYSLSVQQYPDVRSQKQRDHGACYSISLATQYIEKYTKTGDMVFDPFAGVGTTHDACIKLKRHCLGVDISEDFCQTAQTDFPAKSEYNYSIFTDDAANLDQYIGAGSIDFVMTSPPYASLLKNIKNAFAYKWKEHSDIQCISNPRPYSDDKADLGNMDYKDFFEHLNLVMAKLYIALKQEKYMVWVVKDYRDVKNGVPYVNFHGDIIELARNNRFELWDIVIYDQTKFRPLVCLGYPSKKYYHNIGHSYILVFRKGCSPDE